MLFRSIPFYLWKFHATVLPSCYWHHCPASNCSSFFLLFLHMTFRSLLSVLDFSTTLYHFPLEYLFSRTNKKPLLRSGIFDNKKTDNGVFPHYQISILLFYCIHIFPTACVYCSIYSSFLTVYTIYTIKFKIRW